MDVSVVHYLTASITYRELALRSQEFLQYLPYPPGSEQRQLAEDTFFNVVVEYVIAAGMPRPEAETFCDNTDNLHELALRIHSTLGPLV